MTRPHLAPLTGVRGLAASWVVLLHLTAVMTALFPGAWSRAFGLLARPGFLGVDLFFILSGFVISYRYADTFVRGVSGESYRRFIMGRLARVYPVHLAILVALVIAVRLLGAPVGTMDPARWSTAQLVESLFLVHAWTGHAAAWNAVSWSISCEWFVYLLFPAFAMLTERRCTRTPAWALFLATETLLVLPALVAIRWPDAPGRLLIQVTCLFVAGCLLHGLHRRGAEAGIAGRIPGALSIAVLLGAAWCLHRGWSAYVTVPLMAPIVSGLAFGRGHLSRFLSTRAMGYAGVVSFSLYMTHYLWLWVAQSLFPLDRWAGATLPARLGIVACYVIPIPLIAAATYHWLERPARALVMRATAAARRRELDPSAGT